MVGGLWLLVRADTVACRNAEAEWPETGRLALYLLGLRATCPLPEPGPQRLLVTWLKYYLEEDWAGESSPTGPPRRAPTRAPARPAARPLACPSDNNTLSPGSRRHGQPLTSYYQYSLGVLALCVHRKRVREEVIHRLLAAEHHGRFRHTSGSTVGKGPWGQMGRWHPRAGVRQLG